MRILIRKFRFAFLFSGSAIVAIFIFIFMVVAGLMPSVVNESGLRGAEKTVSFRTPESAGGILSINAVGDIMPGSNFPRFYLPSGRGEELYRHVSSLLRGADIVLGNFEAAMTHHNRTPKNVRRRMVFAFRTPPSFARALKEAGFNVLNIANNHSLDFYRRGFRDTSSNLQKAGIETVGERGKILYKQIRGLRVALIGFSYYKFHNSINDLRGTRRITARAARNADIVIVTMHAGAEGIRALRVRNKTEIFYGQNRGNSVRFAHAAVDAGADLVLGHGPHVPRAMELYRGRLIAYSLGNFVGYRLFNLSGPKGLSLILKVHLDGKGRFLSGRIRSLRIRPPGIPVPDGEGKTIQLIRKLTRLDFPRTHLLISKDGRIIFRKKARKKARKKVREEM